MCDPVSLAIVGGVVSGVGSLVSGFQQSAAYNDQAAFAGRQASLEGQAGAYERDRLRTQNDRVLGGQRQQFISSGIDATKGSAAEVIADSAREAALDEEAVLFGAKVRSDNKRFEARLARSNAGSAMIGGVFGAASNLIGGFGSAQNIQFNRTMLSNPYAVGI